MAWGPEGREDREPEALGLQTRGWVREGSNGGCGSLRLTKKLWVQRELYCPFPTLRTGWITL